MSPFFSSSEECDGGSNGRSGEPKVTVFRETGEAGDEVAHERDEGDLLGRAGLDENAEKMPREKCRGKNDEGEMPRGEMPRGSAT
jgi:hypothetical protein